MDKYYYRLSIWTLFAFDRIWMLPLFISGTQSEKVPAYQYVLIGLGYIVAVFGFNWVHHFVWLLETTAMPIAFYIFPIIILLFRRYYHIKLPGVIGNTLTWIGQASYHIFLVQMVYYHFELGGRIMASAWYIALPFNILVTVAAGLAFYEADCRFIRNMKYLKFKAKRRVA